MENIYLKDFKKINSDKELEELRTLFFSNLNHEFMTPINVMSSSLQLLENKLLKDEFQSFDDYLKVQKINQILKLLNKNLLRMTKLSKNFTLSLEAKSNNIKLIYSNEDIVKFTRDICDEINNYIEFSNFALIFKTNIESKIISFDKTIISKILLNLISNAIKYSPQYIKILVNIKCTKRYINISVEDFGIGIDESRLNSIFNTFSDLDNRFTKINEGMGLGLALCKSLIEIHNGKITVKSTLGKGSKFTISLPNLVNQCENENLYCNKIHRITIKEMLKEEFSDICY